MTIRATWNGAVLAESDRTVVVEGNHYFPPEHVHDEYFEESGSHTDCGWKGEASYRSVVVGGARIEDAAWYYAAPKDEAGKIIQRLAFWKGVTVEEVG